MKDNPLISVIINNYNYGRFLREAINSALNQTYSHSEVIVVDDGSTDDSGEIIVSYGDKIIPVLKENGGQASAFNAGFAASRGDIICFLDADDTFIAEKVAVVVDVFRCYQDIGWCFHSLRLLDNNTNKSIKLRHKKVTSECDFRLHMKTNTLPQIPTATSGLCFTRSLLQLILPMPEAIKITSDDYLKYAASALIKGFYLNKELAIQKIHGDNAYTLRDGKQQVKARVCILTAYWIQVKFPSLSKFAKSMFITGIATYWRTGGIAPESREVVDSYFSSFPPLERLKINTRSLYRYLRPSGP